MGEFWDTSDWDLWDPLGTPLPKEAKTSRRISLCTVCMGRLHDLMVTLPVNIHRNQDYPRVEFVVLNYNSPDKLDSWMRDYMMPYIEAGILVYVRTTEPTFYRPSHSRNVAFKMGTGDILVNIDADNLVGRGFARMLNLLAELRPQKAAFGLDKDFVHGQIGFYRTEWFALGGYDEDLLGYSCEDLNLLCRAMEAGFKLMWWRHREAEFCDRIITPEEDKTRYVECKHRVFTEFVNAKTTRDKLRRRQFVVNEGKHWGKATVIKNFRERIEI